MPSWKIILAVVVVLTIIVAVTTMVVLRYTKAQKLDVLKLYKPVNTPSSIRYYPKNDQHESAVIYFTFSEDLSDFALVDGNTAITKSFSLSSAENSGSHSFADTLLTGANPLTMRINTKNVLTTNTIPQAVSDNYKSPYGVWGTGTMIFAPYYVSHTQSTLFFGI